MPQIVLGMAFNFGIIMVFAASINQVPFNAYLLYFAAIASMYYFKSFFLEAYSLIILIALLPSISFTKDDLSTRKYYLSRNSEQIKSISNVVGYRDTAYFCRRFKLMFGVQAGKMKKRINEL